MLSKLITICLVSIITPIVTEIPTITLNNGVKIPVVGLGTSKSKPNQVIQVVKDAIDGGYRHFDCAYSYKNEKEIGQGLAEKIAEGAVRREKLFVTSKLWNNKHKPEEVEGALLTTLKDLKLDYVDLYLIHWPMGFKENGADYAEEDDYLDTWLEMEKLYKKGLAKSIGVSNFNQSQIERLLEHSTVVPVTNQIECNPYLNQEKLLDFCKSKNITVTAYSPLGQAAPLRDQPQLPPVLEHPKIVEISKKLGKTPAQVILRYQVQRGVIVIPKSVTKSRILENSQIFDFELSDGDMASVGGLDVKGRRVFKPEWTKHKYFPFNEY